MDYHKFTNNPYTLSQETHLKLHQKYKIFQQITNEYSADYSKDISKKERDELSLNSISLTYGEIEFISFGEIFEIIKTQHGIINEGGIFYDLGSGSGKGIISAALLHGFNKCIGIEILKGLYDISINLKTNYDLMRISLVQENQDLWTTLPDLEFINGNIFDID